MGYKLKRILIYPDGVTEKQVRPQWNYEYSYDFRNKSSTILANDGWINVLGSASSFTYSSEGIYNSGGASADIMLKKEGFASVISNAKKVELNMVGKTSMYQVSLGFREVATSSQRTGTTGIYYQAPNNSDPTAIYWFIYGTSAYQTVSRSSYASVWVSMTGTFDFENKTLTITDNIGFNKTVTLTDTQISNIKSKMTCLGFALGGQAYMQTISVKIK